MLRDLKFLRRNSSQNPNFDEPENVPVNVKHHESNVCQMCPDSSSRPPLNSIQESAQNPSKVSRTPTKVNGSKNSESVVPMRTPEKQRGLSKNLYGWVSESRNEGKTGNGNGNGITPRSCRTVRATSSGYSESNSTQNTPTKSVSKPPNPGLSHGGISRPPVGGGVRNNTNYSASSRKLQNSYTTVNTVEVPHFDLKEDPSFWMDHNVQVLIRIRPLNNMELSTQGYNRCLKQESAQSLTFLGHPETRFTFDHVACETIDQETLFRMAGLPMVENCLSGYNSCIFAYGQTGSGKTHTMLGEINELEVKSSPYRGMTPRMFEFLFARIIAEEESRVDERLTYNCKCSFLEIYNEQITDLLDPSSTNLQLREDVKKGVYVENLTEYEVHTVGDILRLLSRGSANRRVAATNMNRESSRSHSVFTCEIESRWEKDSTTNLRFARLNLVDLAGSERQKTSGAEGERLKEAASINKSLSTLGHVIMVLVDGANSRTRHIPYRDSRLTFLLQDSLGGNSKTMIIANVSPSICSATETLNTLKFAQRAKLIQNNAVVNEDALGDVIALQHQIQLLKEELAVLKRHNVSRSLTFVPNVIEEARQEHENECDSMPGDDDKILKVSSKQLKSVETVLTGAMRREQMSETSIKHLEAEIELLNRLVRQREEDNKCTKMMLKFREDKIQRMESLLAGSIPADSYLLEENNALAEEIQMLRAKADKNPEVTRFALENIRLLEQLRRFQDFYEEGERDLLLNEGCELRNQLVLFIDENSKQGGPLQKVSYADYEENSYLQLELERSHEELEKCRINLNSCLERNAKLCKEIEDLNALLKKQNSAVNDNDGCIEVIKEYIMEAPVGDQPSHAFLKKNDTPAKYIEEVMNLQLKVDILEMILKEQSVSRGEIEEKTLRLSRDLKLTEDKYMLLTKNNQCIMVELEETRSVIEALEAQQLISINELEDLRNSNKQYVQELREKELKIVSLNDEICNHVSSALQSSSNEQEKLNKMKDSLEKAKRTNNFYKDEREFHASNEEEMDEVRKQVEAETAEVIVCLQEEIISLQQQVHDIDMTEKEARLDLAKYEDNERQLNFMTNEIDDILSKGHDELEDALNDLRDVETSEKLQKITRGICEKELRIKELKCCLEEAKNRGNEMEGMLRSLKGATLAMSEAHQQDCNDKDQILHDLSLELSEKSSMIVQLNNAIKKREEEIKKANICAIGALVTVNRFSEMKDDYLEGLTTKEAELEELKKDHMTCRSSRDVSRRDDTISLLKKELEIALGSLSGVKTEMSKLHSENKVIRLSETQNRRSIEELVQQVLELQSVVSNYEKQVGVAMVSLDHKIQTVEELIQESCKSYRQKRMFQEEAIVSLLEKEIELVIMSSVLLENDSQKKDLEKENKNMCKVFEKVKEYMIISNVDNKILDAILLDKEAENAFFQHDAEEKQRKMLLTCQMLEMSSCKLQEELENKDIELRNMRLHEDEMKSALKQWEAISDMSLKECVNMMSTVDMKNNILFNILRERTVSLEQRFEEINKCTENVNSYIEEFEFLEKLAKEVILENSNLQSELGRKDDVVEGLLFDLRLLQESSSNKQDQKDEIEELTASLEALEVELNENIVEKQVLQSQLKEKVDMISVLKADVSREGELVKSLFSEIEMLTESVKDALKAKETAEMELVRVKKANESFEIELVQLESELVEMRTLVESRTRELDNVSCRRDDLYAEVIELRKELEMSQALAEENEAIATEAKQMAETSRSYAEEKDEEVKLYEKSVQELEFIVNALENQVDMVKGEAERQRLQREELEIEFQAFKQQFNSDSDMKTLLNEKESCLQEVYQRVRILEKEIAAKDSEIIQHKAHINELNLHAEAQAREYKQTFKTLEAMADQVKSDGSGPHISNSPSKKLEKARSRGSGSPFKCIGLGLAHQMKSERDGELAAARQKIEELEALATNRQKEIFALNAKLAMSGSMTHDVLRDLLGIKLDMTAYSSLVDGHQIEDINDKDQAHNAGVQSEDSKVIKLKEQLNELVIERKGWLEEIERKQAEMITAQVALEQLRQRDRLLSTENEMFKNEIHNHKMKVLELETEVNKLSGQQNLQQRIHHHAKIKEENNSLKAQNENLSRKLRKTDATLCRCKEELANLRAASGKNSYCVEAELQIDEKLKETEDERDQVAQKLAALCFSILKAAGVTGTASDDSVSMAEEALEQFQKRVVTLERELKDLQFKTRISNERVRLSEIMPQMANETRETNSR
ncbi:kinesin-like protein KIN-12D [Rutidosis leptorrhynchoides]|uniref:kinesin-like protein KIN-12D n=1 Tax=Rutidosis leptorrhynchoides TaxID=125765 RepID=UPI003A992923